MILGFVNLEKLKNLVVDNIKIEIASAQQSVINNKTTSPDESSS